MLWRAVDAGGHELDVVVQKRRNKKSAILFLTRLLGCYPSLKIIVTDKLKSYIKPIRQMCPTIEHRSHKGKFNIWCSFYLRKLYQFLQLLLSSI